MDIKLAMKTALNKSVLELAFLKRWPCTLLCDCDTACTAARKLNCMDTTPF